MKWKSEKAVHSPNPICHNSGTEVRRVENIVTHRENRKKKKTTDIHLGHSLRISTVTRKTKYFDSQEAFGWKYENMSSPSPSSCTMLHLSYHQPYCCEAVKPCTVCAALSHVWTLMSDQCLVLLVTLPYAIT